MLNIKERIRIWNEYHNPLYYWWKVRKIFKRPKIHFIFGKNIYMFGFPINKKYYHPILYVKFSNLGWKPKYDDVRHEWDPYIHIRLFKKWDFIWLFNWVRKHDRNSAISSMATWEAILEMAYDNLDINTAINKNVWVGATPYTNLTKSAKREYNAMKYWVCKDKDGINVYYGKVKPVYNVEENLFNSVEDDYDWIEERVLNLLHIKYPYKINEGECIRIFIDVKSKW